MSSLHQVTTDQLLFRDPEVYPPPRGVNMLLLNPGGVLIVGQWSDDCLAWCPKPKIPQSVKQKMTGGKNAPANRDTTVPTQLELF